jgi:hypothetical protein
MSSYILLLVMLTVLLYLLISLLFVVYISCFLVLLFLVLFIFELGCVVIMLLLYIAVCCYMLLRFRSLRVCSTALHTEE